MITGSCHCGAVEWRYERVPERATACNCTLCRRYGTLWAYGWESEGEGVTTTGETAHYVRGDREIGFHFCARCGCVTWWRALVPDEEARTRIAVNLRMAEPQAVMHIPIRHFDGLDSWDALPDDGACVHDLWS